VLQYSVSVLLYSSVLLCCSLLFILRCSSYCYVCVFDCIYCTSTLPQSVNPIAVNKYLSVLKMIRYGSLIGLHVMLRHALRQWLRQQAEAEAQIKFQNKLLQDMTANYNCILHVDEIESYEFPSFLHVDRTESMDLLYHNTSTDLTHILSQHPNCRLLSQSSSQDTKI
jgi:hypothetical protein